VTLSAVFQLCCENQVMIKLALTGMRIRTCACIAPLAPIHGMPLVHLVPRQAL
jgi:hypothetical protein